ncbi:MAG TPA: BON domain-containing protein [Planctomicrobium sp.]|nr:BON domain-containing protein [Planctomicrobium sp.]
MPRYQSPSPLLEATDVLPDGPVPGFAQSGICGEESCKKEEHDPHSIERNVQRALLTLTEVSFSSLQVHRMKDGICLTGVMKVPCHCAKPPIERIAGRASGVVRVLNHLMVRTEEELPEEP